MATLRGFAARALRLQRIDSGTITVRDQYATLLVWNGNHLGNSMISTGTNGTPRQGSWSYMASSRRVNTFALAAPPCFRIAARARTMWGASGESPTIFRA